MAITSLDIHGYRSLKRIHLKFSRINVILGPNGCGKTNLYKALQLLAAAAAGELGLTLIQEGGIHSAMWAGPRLKGPIQIQVAVQTSDFSYSLTCGLPPRIHPAYSLFNSDPQIKEERLALFSDGRRIEFLKRKGPGAWLRGLDGEWEMYDRPLVPSESVLSQLRSPRQFPELAEVREQICGWRFYHQFRTDAHSPLRNPQRGTYTPVLSHDGLNLAAALRTIEEQGESDLLSAAIANGLDGATLDVHKSRAAFCLSLQMPGFQRPFTAEELSDGTLRYLCLVAATLSLHPPDLIAFNEPESSLHSDLIEPLADLLVLCSQRSQLWITTHSDRLAEAIARRTGVSPLELAKVDGQTRVVSSPWDDSEDEEE